MRPRIWVYACVSVFFSSIILLALVNFIVDPYQMYRKADLYDVYFAQERGRYLNAGMAKNYNYESVVIGTSSSANFRLDELREKLLFPEPIKLIIPGAGAYEENITLAKVFAHRNVETVLYGLDIAAFQVGAEGFLRDAADFPAYLYADGLNTDFRYLASADTLRESVSAVWRSRRKRGDILFSYERMYEWQHTREKNFGKDQVLAAWHRKIATPSKGRGYSFEGYVESFDGNILPHIAQHPDTRFIIFYPPYSILRYKLMQMSGTLGEYLEFKKYIYSATRHHGNVEIYDFQVATEVTHNLDHYKDLSHYHQRFNSWMLEQIAAGSYRVSEDSVERYHSGLLEQVDAYNLSLVSPVTASATETPSSSPARR
jgi:hypothetical protein